MVVLSNNDGCVVARSNEAKALGIPMGAPYFKYAARLRQAGAAVFSSNYALYGDLSRRVMQVLAGFAPRIEVYSIDECFLDLAGVRDPTALGLEIARTVRQWTGIPVAVGIAPTKTLAKLANRLAKKGLGPAGPVLDWSALPDPAAVLAAVPVEDVWGIASRWGQRLRALGIADARALSAADPRRLRQRFGVVVERVAWELRGRSCLPLECVAPPRKQVMVSRSFGGEVTDLAELRAAVTAFATRAGEKLRAQGLAAQALTVFVQTDPFETVRPFYANALTVPFAVPTQDSGVLIRSATHGRGAAVSPGRRLPQGRGAVAGCGPRGAGAGRPVRPAPRGGALSRAPSHGGAGCGQPPLRTRHPALCRAAGRGRLAAAGRADLRGLDDPVGAAADGEGRVKPRKRL